VELRALISTKKWVGGFQLHRRCIGPTAEQQFRSAMSLIGSVEGERRNPSARPQHSRNRTPVSEKRTFRRPRPGIHQRADIKSAVDRKSAKGHQQTMAVSYD